MNRFNYYQDGGGMQDAQPQQGTPTQGSSQIPPQVMQLIQQYFQMAGLSQQQQQEFLQKFSSMQPAEQQQVVQAIQQKLQSGDQQQGQDQGAPQSSQSGPQGGPQGPDPSQGQDPNQQQGQPQGQSQGQPQMQQGGMHKSKGFSPVIVAYLNTLKGKQRQEVVNQISNLQPEDLQKFEQQLQGMMSEKQSVNDIPKEQYQDLHDMNDSQYKMMMGGIHKKYGFGGTNNNYDGFDPNANQGFGNQNLVNSFIKNNSYYQTGGENRWGYSKGGYFADGGKTGMDNGDDDSSYLDSIQNSNRAMGPNIKGLTDTQLKELNPDYDAINRGVLIGAGQGLNNIAQSTQSVKKDNLTAQALDTDINLSHNDLTSITQKAIQNAKKNESPVMELQRKLIQEGYLKGKNQEDGIFGDRTKIALESYQTDHGLVVDGIAGKLTKAKMGIFDGGTLRSIGTSLKERLTQGGSSPAKSGATNPIAGNPGTTIVTDPVTGAQTNVVVQQPWANEDGMPNWFKAIPESLRGTVGDAITKAGNHIDRMDINSGKLQGRFVEGHNMMPNYTNDPKDWTTANPFNGGNPLSVNANDYSDRAQTAAMIATAPFPIEGAVLKGIPMAKALGVLGEKFGSKVLGKIYSAFGRTKNVDKAVEEVIHGLPGAEKMLELPEAGKTMSNFEKTLSVGGKGPWKDPENWWKVVAKIGN